METPRSAPAVLPSCSADGLVASLKKLLSEPVSQVQKREQMELDRLLAERTWRCVIFGAGSMGRRALAALGSIGVRPLALSDNNPALWGTEVEGVPLISPPDAARRYGRSAHFFIAIRNEHHFYQETCDQLTNLGCAHVSSSEPIAWRFPDIFPPFLLYNLPHRLYQQADRVLAAADLWADDLSRAEYLAQVRLRALGDPSGLSAPAQEESYFLDGVFQAEPGEVFLDCGAFDGDTIRTWMERRLPFRRIEAVEADSRSYDRLSAYVASFEPRVRNKIRLHKCAVGSQRGKVRFEDSGLVDSKISNSGGIVVDMLPIDALFAHKHVSMIKMDIEGGEFDALMGASEVIARDRPILAICVYHLQEDLWRLPLLLGAMVPEYRMYLKSYCGDGIQTVMYAVPPQRVRGAQQSQRPAVPVEMTEPAWIPAPVPVPLPAMLQERQRSRGTAPPRVSR